jgi:hypothetical protein
MVKSIGALSLVTLLLCADVATSWTVDKPTLLRQIPPEFEVMPKLLSLDSKTFLEQYLRIGKPVVIKQATSGAFSRFCQCDFTTQLNIYSSSNILYLF